MPLQLDPYRFSSLTISCGWLRSVGGEKRLHRTATTVSSQPLQTATPADGESTDRGRCGVVFFFFVFLVFFFVFFFFKHDKHDCTTNNLIPNNNKIV